jgi:hypothetical protein
MMTTSVRTLVLCAILAIPSAHLQARTPDTLTPSRETVCDNETGAAYGLCVSACEARDCFDPNQTASDKSCEVAGRNFEKLTGRPLPCLVTCPCANLLALFGQIETGQVVVTQCIAFPTLLYVATEQGDFALVDDGPPANCNVNGEPPFVQLNDTERQVCRVTLRRAVEAQGIVCQAPE